MKYADRSGIRHALLMGSAEQERQVLTLKDLSTGHQQAIPHAGFAAAIKEIVSGA